VHLVGHIILQQTYYFKSHITTISTTTTNSNATSKFAMQPELILVTAVFGLKSRLVTRYETSHSADHKPYELPWDTQLCKSECLDQWLSNSRSCVHTNLCIPRHSTRRSTLSYIIIKHGRQIFDFFSNTVHCFLTKRCSFTSKNYYCTQYKEFCVTTKYVIKWSLKVVHRSQDVYNLLTLK
jgi:hypothetical protein